MATQANERQKQGSTPFQSVNIYYMPAMCDTVLGVIKAKVGL